MSGHCYGCAVGKYVKSGTPNMINNMKFGFAAAMFLPLLGLIVHIYVAKNTSRQNTYLPVPNRHLAVNATGRGKSRLATRLMVAPHGPTSFAIREGKINKLLISPNSIPKTLLSRLDRSTKDAFLSKLKRMKRRPERVMNETAGHGDLVDAYGVLSSMGYSSRLPDVINIGVKKGGTTALMFYLKNHPQIQTSLDAREVHYFDWHYDNGLRWYESRMKIARNDQLVYEKTPRYYIHDHVAKRIHRDLGEDLRFLLCVRDPVSRLISDFHFSKQIRASKRWKKQQTAEKESKRFIKTVLEKNGSVKSDNEMVMTSNYAIHFKRWLEYFRRDQFLIVDNSEMVHNLSGILRQVEAFLGLRPFYQKSMFLRTKKDQTCLRIDSRTSCPRNIGASILPKPKVSPELGQKLRDYYRPHNKEFEILTGRKFDWTEL